MAVMPPAPGMVISVSVGWPGMCLRMWRAASMA